MLCESYFHNRCAKRLNNINILDENTLKCCENDELPEDNDKEFFEAVSQNSTAGNSIDIRIFKLMNFDNTLYRLFDIAAFDKQTECFAYIQ